MAGRYRVTSLPTVKAFRNGQIVNEFMGALPETSVRAFFQDPRADTCREGGQSSPAH